MKYSFHFILLTKGISALVGRHRDAVHTPPQSLQYHYTGWKTGLNHHQYEGTIHRLHPTHKHTVTVTVTVTIDQSQATLNNTSSSPTAPATEDLAPITLIEITSSSAKNGSTTSLAEGLSPVTLIDIETVPSASINTADAAAAPTPNDLAPITLIDIVR